MFRCYITRAIVRQQSLTKIASKTDIKLFRLYTFYNVDVKHHIIIIKIKCWNYQVLANLSTSYS